MLKAMLITPHNLDLIAEHNNGQRPTDEIAKYCNTILIYSDVDPSVEPELISFEEFTRDYRWFSLQDNYNAVEKV